ncbi:twin-arginine translocase subunit TatC [uncultured Ilyobacter sp.]|uniref:twin-arginine translocase subunit TatC n=1 Tax=uncultured Ilyobacter sp. TaxID=544433 RepID=UPI002AA65BF6|nr:twin-arginine translocase subunit TatC [uncultured Ilyobacter sp.]
MEANAASDKYMHIFEHLKELRKKLIISVISFAIFVVVAFAIHNQIVDLFIKFYSSIPSGGENKLFVNSIVEGMTTKIKISLIMGLILSMPLHLYNIVAFIFPALNKKEKMCLAAALICSFVLVIVSIYLSYFKILPISIKFLTDSDFIPQDVGLLLNYNTNLFYALYFVFWSIIGFQSPIVFVLLMAFNIVKRKTALAASRYIIVFIFIISAVVTPPDVVSQVGLALPLVILYFLAILVAKIFKFGE